MNNKIKILNNLLENVVDILNENNIPYYLDCGTLLGIIRENSIMDKDTDIDVTTHISFWGKLNKIDFGKYGLIRTRTRGCKTKGYIISVKTKTSHWYCDIYVNPAFPQLDIKNFNGKNYSIPKNSELYLSQIYKDWKIPSGQHANWPKYFYTGLIKSPYSKYWDLDYMIQLNPIPPIPKKNNLNKLFWDTYYNNSSDDIKQPSTFAEFIYTNYVNDVNKSILDLGAGNCRDSVFFHSKGNKVTPIDYNGQQNNTSIDLNLIKEDVEYFLKEDTNTYDIIYMRWFLHAMPYDKAKSVF